MGLAKWWTTDVVTTSIRQGRTLVAVDGDEVVGVATFGVQDDAFVLWKLYVLPGHHGQGIGSALLATVLEEAEPASTARSSCPTSRATTRPRASTLQRASPRPTASRAGAGLPDQVWMRARSPAAPRRRRVRHRAGDRAGRPRRELQS